MSDSNVKIGILPSSPKPPNELIYKILSYIKNCIKRLLNNFIIIFIVLLLSIFFLINYMVNNFKPMPEVGCEQKYQKLTRINQEITLENDQLKGKINEIQLLLDKNKSELEICNKKSKIINKLEKLVSLEFIANIAETAGVFVPEEERNKIYYRIIDNKRYLEIINDIDEYNKISKDLSNKDKITDFEKKLINKICEEKPNKDQIIGFLCQLSSVQTLPK